MTQPSRKPLDRILGNNEESVAFSLADRTMGFLNKAGLLSWLNLFFQFKPQACNINITNNETNTYVVTGTGTDQLVPPTGYVQIGGFSLGSGTSNHDFVLNNGNELVLPDDGYYDIDGWLNFRHSTNSSTAAVVFRFEDPQGGIVFSQRPTGENVPNNGRLGLITGGGSSQFTAGTKVTFWIASDNSGTITIPNSTVRVFKYAD